MRINALIVLLAAFTLLGCEENNEPEEDDFSGTSGTFTDPRDGEEYNWVKIGDQIWMAENLRATVYPDGTSILHVLDNTEWGNLQDNNTDDAYCFYNNQESDPYGALYTWAAAIGDNIESAISSSNLNPSGIQGVCPVGWHLPSEKEWIELENYLADNGFNYDGSIGGGGEKIAKALATTTGWETIEKEGAVGFNQASNNSSGFCGGPGGHRLSIDFPNTFGERGTLGYWWTSTRYTNEKAFYCYLVYAQTYLGRDPGAKSNGFSVRCVKDDF